MPNPGPLTLTLQRGHPFPQRSVVCVCAARPWEGNATNAKPDKMRKRFVILSEVESESPTVTNADLGLAKIENCPTTFGGPPLLFVLAHRKDGECPGEKFYPRHHLRWSPSPRGRNHHPSPKTMGGRPPRWARNRKSPGFKVYPLFPFGVNLEFWTWNRERKSSGAVRVCTEFSSLKHTNGFGKLFGTA